MAYISHLMDIGCISTTSLASMHIALGDVSEPPHLRVISRQNDNAVIKCSYVSVEGVYLKTVRVLLYNDGTNQLPSMLHKCP